jgi:2'-5' RNA ligase
MTQIFCNILQFKSYKKPVWFDEFRKKYDKPYRLHITLRSPCFVDDSNIDGLKEDVSNIFSTIKIKNHKLVIYFNQIFDPNLRLMV